jgi:PAS domain S-box-containing protein
MCVYKEILMTGPEAVCILDANLEIRQHNHAARLLLEYDNGELTGRHISEVIYDGTLIQDLLAMDNFGWLHGNCTIKTSHDLPMKVKFRVALWDSINRDNSTGLNLDSVRNGNKEYIIVFRETEEYDSRDRKRITESLRYLMDILIYPDRELEDILLNFARIFDQYAEAIILPPDFSENRDFNISRIAPLSESFIRKAKEAVRCKSVLFHCDENQWCFFPILSKNWFYGTACMKLSLLSLYSNSDRELLALAGAIFGAYLELYVTVGSVSSFKILLSILENMDSAVIVVNRKGNIILCNSAAKIMYGYTETGMMGMLFSDLICTEGYDVIFKDSLDRVLEGETLRNQNIIHVSSDLNTFEAEFTAHPYRLDDGSIIGAVFIIKDSAEKIRLWNKMMQWEKLSILGELLSSVANELNNPLTSITGYSQLLLHRGNDRVAENMALTIYEEAKRCGNIVSSVLDLARGDKNDSQYTHINDIINASLDLKKHQLRSENIDISLSLKDNIPGSVPNPHEIERLFLRIINYAERRMIEYSNGGKLAVESSFRDGDILVRFSDTGTCIMEDDISEIFDPFFNGGNEDDGIGLGLSISCRILRNTGGKIYIESHLGKGNEITVELPVIMDCYGSVEHTEETNTYSEETGKKVMVVDDEPAIVDLLTEILQQMGHIADVARDGNEAMNKLEEQEYDLIIADLRMPSGFTGDRLHKFIKIKNPDLAQRMVFITGDVTNPETEKFLQSTGNPYLEKPFLLGKLRDTIQRSLGKSTVNE